jgi:predicted nucleotidyltransferase component of viral defense system
MIDSDEIKAKAEELGVNIANVERDYVFGWLLAGLFHTDNELRYRLILKGGNGFRKAYFRDARFSKDLDFSMTAAFDPDAFNQRVKQACEYVADMTGIEFDFGRQNVKLKRGADTDQQSFESRVYFKGFYGEEECTISAKLDIKEFDRILLPIQEQPLIHAYSDAAVCQARVRTMKLEELLANKLKALLQRDHSPDLFDFVYAVFVQNVLAINRLELASTFLRKTIYERQPFAAYEQLLKRPFAVIREAWGKYLVLPKVSLINFERAEELFLSGIEAIFVLMGVDPRRAPVFAAQASLDYFTAERRSLIMEAGRLQRLLEVTYKGYPRIVEPYSLAYKRRQDGVAREYFYVHDRSGGASRQQGIKTFTNDNLTSLRLLDESFEPRHPIELAKAGEYFGKTTFSTGVRNVRPSEGFAALRPLSIFGKPRAKPKPYVLLCPMCQKEFRRESMRDTSLNAHQNTWGGKCSASRGYWK